MLFDKQILQYLDINKDYSFVTCKVEMDRDLWCKWRSENLPYEVALYYPSCISNDSEFSGYMSTVYCWMKCYVKGYWTIVANTNDIRYYDDMPTSCLLCFENKSDAAIFKLRWTI